VILVIDDAVKKRIADVLGYADRHPWRPEVETPDKVPGDFPQYVATIGHFRCVFTYTIDNGFRYRHLSLSVDLPCMSPHPIAAFMLAQAFGFTGWDERNAMAPAADWMIGNHRGDGYIVVIAQTIGTADGKLNA
jgi:hypothetical protein